MSREMRAEKDRGVMLRTSLVCLGVALLFPLTSASAGELIIFFQDGRTIQAEKTEIIGDRVRIQRPSETIEVPRSDVLSIHPVSPPKASPGAPPPADVYWDITPQMTDKVRREIQGQPSPSQSKSP